MNLSLTPEDQRFIEEQVKAGRFASAEEVVGAALGRLRGEGENDVGDFDAGELDALVAAGEADIEKGDVLTVEQVRENLRQRSQEFRRGNGS